MFPLFKNSSATRRLGVLLVVFILYGTTVEAAHRHGRTLPSRPSAASQVDNEQGKNLGRTNSGCNDCLICQLHQNLNTTLIALRLNDPPIQLPQRTTAVVLVDVLSELISPVASRAPPQAN